MKMKLTIIIALIVCLGLCITVNAATVKVDGIMNERFWFSTDSKHIISSRDISNCGVKFATVNYYCDAENNLLYIGIKVECNPVTGEVIQPGLAVSIDGSDFMTLTMDGVSTYDTNNYSFSGKIQLFNEQSYTAEVALGMKFGVKYGATLAFRLMDMDGIPSNVYYDVVPEPPTTKVETTTAVTTQKETTTLTTTERSTANTTTLKETTTKPKETKPTTEKTTKRVNNPKDETRKIIVDAEVVTVYITVEILSENYDAHDTAAAAVTKQSDTKNEFSDRNASFMRKVVSACVVGLITMSLSFCVAVNVAHDRRMKAEEKKDEK